MTAFPVTRLRRLRRTETLRALVREHRLSLDDVVMDTLYAYGKPFLVAEWGLKGADDPVFASHLFAWASAHPRTVGVVYFNKGWSGGTGIYELRTKPHSLAVYRTAIRSARFLSALP